MPRLTSAFALICSLTSLGAICILIRQSGSFRGHINDDDGGDDSQTQFDSGRFDMSAMTSNFSQEMQQVNLTVEELAEMHRKRRQLRDKVCEKARFTKMPRHMAGPTLLLNKRLKFLYCAIGKVATSTWERVLIQSAGRFEDDDRRLEALPHHLEQAGARRILGRLKPPYSFITIAKKYRRYFRFMFVRHPFERLVSAFVSKFHDPNDNGYVQEFGPRIIRMYRHNASHRSLKHGRDVRFNEFVRYIVEKTQTRRAARDDFHWRPMFEACLPCRINFTFIGHYETMALDSAYVLNVLGVAARVQFPEVRDRKLRHSEERTREMFAKVSADDVERLRELYRLDFEMFGYDPYAYSGMPAAATQRTGGGKSGSEKS